MHTLAGSWKSSGETRRIKKKEIQKTQTIFRLELGTIKDNLLPKTMKETLAHGASSLVDQESQKNTEATWDHHLQISPNTSHYMEAVFSMVRKISGKQPGYPIKYLNVNLAIGGMFMNTTLRAAVHLGKDYDTNLRFVKIYLWKTKGQLFRETEKLISGQTDTTGIGVINFQDLRWVSTSLMHSRPYQYATAKVYVFSDSVLCLGKKGNNLVESWKKQIQWYSDDDYFSELNRIYGQPMEFEWKIFPGFTTVGIIDEIQRMMGKLQCEPENFTSRIIFKTMFNDIVWDAEGNDALCVNNSKTIEEYAERFPRGHLSFLGPGSEKKWYRTCDGKPVGSWNRTAEKNAAEFQRFRCHVPAFLKRVQLRSKEGGGTTIHFNGGTENIKLLLQMVMPVNQLSLCGAAADMIAELPVGQRAPGKPVASGQLDKQEILTQGNLLQEYEERFEKLSEDQKLSRLCTVAG